MALRTVTVKSAGGDYSSLNAAFVGEVGDLVSLNRQLEIACSAFSDATSADSGAGWTTDATRTVLVRAVDNHLGFMAGTGGTSSPTAYYVQTQVAYRISFATMRGLSLGGGVTTGFGGPATSLVFDRCIGTAGVFSDAFTFWGSGIAVDCLVTSSGGVGFGAAQDGLTVTLYNCTAVSCVRGYTANGTTSVIVAKNCAAVSCTTGFDQSTIYTGSSNCASTDANVPTSGSGHRANQVILFNGPSTGDYHLDASDVGAKGFGTDLSADPTFAFSIDITGATRTVPWDIGAFLPTGTAQFGYLLEYQRILLEDGSSVLLNEVGGAFTTEISAISDTQDRLILEDSSGIIALEGAVVSNTLGVSDESLSSAAQTNVSADEVVLTLAQTNAPADESLLAVALSGQPADESAQALAGSTATSDESVTTPMQSIAVGDESLLTIAAAPAPADEALVGVSLSPTPAYESVGGLASSSPPGDESLGTIADAPDVGNESLAAIAQSIAPADEGLLGLAASGGGDDEVLAGIASALAAGNESSAIASQSGTSADENTLIAQSAGSVADEALAGVTLDGTPADEALAGIVVAAPVADELAAAIESAGLIAPAEWLATIATLPSTADRAHESLEGVATPIVVGEEALETIAGSGVVDDQSLGLVLVTQTVVVPTESAASIEEALEVADESTALASAETVVAHETLVGLSTTAPADDESLIGLAISEFPGSESTGLGAGVLSVGDESTAMASSARTVDDEQLATARSAIDAPTETLSGIAGVVAAVHAWAATIWRTITIAWASRNLIPPGSAIAGPRPTTAALVRHAATAAIDPRVARAIMSTPPVPLPTTVTLMPNPTFVTLVQPQATAQLERPVATASLAPSTTTATLTTVSATVELED